LQQYFLRTADNDVERYLKLFTFLSLDEIDLLMGQQRQDESKRLAQHILAKEIVELAHGAAEAEKAETAHKEAFSQGTTTFSLGALRNTLSSIKAAEAPTNEPLSKKDQELIAYKKAYAASSTVQAIPGATHEHSRETNDKIVTLPISMLQPGSFPRVLHAAGLASSKSEAHRLIASKGAYVVVPNSGSTEHPTGLQWINIEAGAAADPSHFLVDWEALILRSGKSKIQICRVVTEEQFKAQEVDMPKMQSAQS
jgi:tyrosyl-tRNA synthetase